ncbi:hypothetical protein H5410_038380 [Solanum commersonii]|uniref:Ribonuclease H1 N-terminal domain-containing protein n=1 Tax=Solanum commersonii TaxID=4109 RepID=A0A9J5YCZ3_SOLCO|nr:hypothetical protein H5410_038380 [Solanum commersonii]
MPNRQHMDSIQQDSQRQQLLHFGIQGRLQGVFQTWIEVIDSIKDFSTPLFKGFDELNEALDYARGTLGPNYFISLALRQISRPSFQYNIQKDIDKIIFCDHCSSMIEGFKRLNQTIERLETEKGKMTKHIHSLQERIRFLLENTNQTIPLKSSPSHYKMDKMGVHSPTNVERAIVLAKGTASPVQTVAGKDSSNPLMVDTLPKSRQAKRQRDSFKREKKRIEKIIKSSLYKLLTKKTKEVIQEKIIRENPEPEPDPADSNREDIESRSDENNLSIDQFNQHYDPNEDDNLGMSFDSIALHNLNT